MLVDLSYEQDFLDDGCQPLHFAQFVVGNRYLFGDLIGKSGKETRVEPATAAGAGSPA